MSVLLNASVIRNADGQYVSSRSTVFDITERDRAKQDLAKQTTILQSVLNSMGEGVVVADMDGRFVLWNPAADRLLRLGPAHLQPKEWSTYVGYICPTKSPCIPSSSSRWCEPFGENRSRATNSLCGIPEGPAESP